MTPTIGHTHRQRDRQLYHTDILTHTQTQIYTRRDIEFSYTALLMITAHRDNEAHKHTQTDIDQ